MAVMITTEHLLLQIPLLGEARDGLMLKHDLTRLTAHIQQVVQRDKMFKNFTNKRG